MDVKYGKKVFIRNSGKDEFWLQKIIYENPSILGLGDLISVNKEKTQSSGGRLDILLKDQEDNTMYEVEVMLGETDPSHIIRSIEYWDNEKRKYPQRQHFAVLIAESFDRRYFNVVQLLSLNIPMIAIQADLLEVNKEYILNFTKILDVYIEPEDNEDEKPVGDTTWKEKSPWTVSTAKEFFELIETPKKSMNYTQSYISIVIEGKKAYAFDKRTKPTTLLLFSVKDDEKVDLIKELLNKESIDFTYNRYKDFVLNIDSEIVKNKKKLFLDITNIRFKEKENPD